jgi:hypothetical protein
MKELFTWLSCQILALVVSILASWFLVNTLVDVLEVLYIERIGQHGEFGGAVIIGLIVSTIFFFALINAEVIRRIFPEAQDKITEKLLDFFD